MSDTIKISVVIPIWMYESITGLINDRYYPSTAEFVRQSISQRLTNYLDAGVNVKIMPRVRLVKNNKGPNNEQIIDIMREYGQPMTIYQIMYYSKCDQMHVIRTRFTDLLSKKLVWNYGMLPKIREVVKTDGTVYYMQKKVKHYCLPNQKNVDYNGERVIHITKSCYDVMEILKHYDTMTINSIKKAIGKLRKHLVEYAVRSLESHGIVKVTDDIVELVPSDNMVVLKRRKIYYMQEND